MAEPIFCTDRRIRLGIWGLGRGLHLTGPCSLLNIDVVAGCDTSASMRRNFEARYPGVFVTDDAGAFLEQDFDAVLLASYCTEHGPDAVRCLRAGKHVLSEVTSFATMAEGARLVEAVEETGLVYQLAENYPFTRPNQWLARRWGEGLFGDLMYGEYEYVHEVLALSYVDINGVPIEPGNRPHAWRSWFSYHYYDTHSLGPIMLITGERPVRVVSLPGDHALPGYLMRGRWGLGGAAPSLIRMSGGGLVRNLMAASTNDSHIQRLWGTRGSAEQVDGRLRLRLGGHGGSPKLEVEPKWDSLGEMAESTGHGGGDFWVLYYFARELLTGEPGPWNVYAAADCTIPGILAYRSQAEGGVAYDVPDFRRPAERHRWRDDEFHSPRFDVENGLFGEGASDPRTLRFASTMRDLIAGMNAWCAWRDWSAVAADLSDPAALRGVAEGMLREAPRLRAACASARELIEAHPATPAARVLREQIERADLGALDDPAFEERMRRETLA
ncbi:MAG TPA: Gfo/Idh/MocA family oxidoreductase [Chthonomonadales bacterium]|nr:Gfo/Idh/MocA family oxidoreductase [Chthonomonadales bacterium]